MSFIYVQETVAIIFWHYAAAIIITSVVTSLKNNSIWLWSHSIQPSAKAWKNGADYQVKLVQT